MFTGDPYQIDTPYLDSRSNGLTYLIDKMKGQKLYAHINLEKGERSELAPETDLAPADHGPGNDPPQRLHAPGQDEDEQRQGEGQEQGGNQGEPRALQPLRRGLGTGAA